MMAQQYHEEAVEEQQEEQGMSSGVSSLFILLYFAVTIGLRFRDYRWADDGNVVLAVPNDAALRRNASRAAYTVKRSII